MKKTTLKPIETGILTIILICLSIAFPYSIVAQSTNTSNRMGINLSWGFQDWCGDRLFADVMKMSRNWALPGHDGASEYPASIDSTGWPTEDAEIVVWAGPPNMMGLYKLSFTCVNNPDSVSITARWCTATISNRAVNGTTVSYDINVTAGGSGLLLGFVNTKGGVQQVEMMRPLTPGSATTYSSGTLFTNELKALVNKFSVVRFMDYFNTNSNELVSWDQRQLPGYASQQVRTINSVPVGGCYEYAIQFCNETGKDMWLNIPLKANDDYITKVAQLIKYGSDGINPYTSPQANPVYPPLNSNLNVYVEYSNEIWNTAAGFAQGNENHDLAMAEVNTGNSPLNFDGETNDWYWAWRRIGMKIVGISNILRSVFGDADMLTRVRPVLEGQQGFGGPIQSALLLIDQIYGQNTTWCSDPHPVNYYIYGCGGSAYYNPDDGSDTLTIDNIWSSQTMAVQNWLPICRGETAYSHAFGVKRIAYEGGPSFDNEGHSESVKQQAWGDARMTANLINHFDSAWSATDGDLLVYYESTGDYQWAFTQNIFNLNTPKLQGINQLNTQNKAPATICNVPPTILNGTDIEVYFGNSTYAINTMFHIKTHMYGIYLFRVTQSGTYNVSANINGTATLVLDGISEATVTGSNTDIPSYTMSNLQPGLHAVMFKTDNTHELDINTVIIDTGAGQNTITAISATMNNGISVYPSPASDYVTIALSGKYNQPSSIRITNVGGTEVLRTNQQVKGGELRLDISRLPNGIYFINIASGNTTSTSKLVVTR